MTSFTSGHSTAIFANRIPCAHGFTYVPRFRVSVLEFKVSVLGLSGLGAYLATSRNRGLQVVGPHKKGLHQNVKGP